MAAILQTKIFEIIFVSENVCILMSLKCVPSDSISNKPALVLIIAWCRSSDKPLFDSMIA